MADSRLRHPTRSLLALLPLLLCGPAAFADCAPVLSAGGTGLSPVVSNSDRRALESLLGAQIDEVVCAFMNAERRFGLRPPAKTGFFVLTPVEMVFVRDRKTMEILFRAEFAHVGRLGWNDFGLHTLGSTPPFDEPLELTLAIGGEFFSFTLSCAGGAVRVLDELERRIAVPVSRPSGASTSLPCS